MIGLADVMTGWLDHAPAWAQLLAGAWFGLGVLVIVAGLRATRPLPRPELDAPSNVRVLTRPYDQDQDGAA